jgi:hypothetical protein
LLPGSLSICCCYKRPRNFLCSKISSDSRHKWIRTIRNGENATVLCFTHNMILFLHGGVIRNLLELPHSLTENTSCIRTITISWSASLVLHRFSWI